MYHCWAPQCAGTPTIHPKHGVEASFYFRVEIGCLSDTYQTLRKPTHHGRNLYRNHRPQKYMASRIDEKWVLDRINEVVIVGDRDYELRNLPDCETAQKFRRLNSQIITRVLRNC